MTFEYDFMFIVLTYRNTKDLESFFESVKTIQGTYKVIVVNSFYDEISRAEFEKIAKRNDSDFLNVENRGYGAGNNRGVEFANEHYTYRYLVISNPDIIFKNFKIDLLNNMENRIIAPRIVNLRGKHQNPYKPLRLWFVDGFQYYSLKYPKLRFLYLIAIIINRLFREFFLLTNKIFRVKRRRIYAAHGSCVIIGYQAIQTLGQLYNEKMFLFTEEEHLANLARSKKIKTYMMPKLQILHKEDGSVSLVANKLINKYVVDSYIIWYELWNKKKGEKK